MGDALGRDQQAEPAGVDEGAVGQIDDDMTAAGSRVQRLEDAPKLLSCVQVELARRGVRLATSPLEVWSLDDSIHALFTRMVREPREDVDHVAGSGGATKPLMAIEEE